MKTRSLELTRFALVLVLALAVGAVAAHAQTARTATAVAQVVDGYVVGVTLTDGGAGYGVPPTVSFVGGGSGAMAETRVRNGAVDRIVLIAAGSGYSSQTQIGIAAPAMPMLSSVQPMIALTIQGQVGATHQILATDELVPATWRLLNNVVVANSPYVWMDEAGPLQERYYRVAAQSEAPLLESARLVGRLTIQGTVGTTNWILGTDLAVPHVWRVLTNVVVSSSPYVWVDATALSLERQYQVSTTPEVPVEKVDPRQWAWIPPGMFTMGSPSTERGRYAWEGPQTRVTLTKGFWMGRCEVTQAEYQAVMRINPSSFLGDMRRPVENVSWNDATNYCGKLTAGERTAGRLPAGYQYRLPTEAEWEYACRAGATTPFHYGNALRSGMANFDGRYEYPPCGNSTYFCENPSGTYLARTTPVGSYAANAWGLYDMHGNVWEWCRDWLSGGLPGRSVTDPQGPPTGLYRVIRGGGWNYSANYCRSAFRNDGPSSDGHTSNVGFRAVLAPGQ